jgi:hypothetical protein
MERLTYAFSRGESPLPLSTTIDTTLYDLIEAIAAEVSADEEALVTVTTVHILRSHKARFVDMRMRGQACSRKVNYLNAVSA